MGERMKADHEAEVIVLGAGASGLMAAVTAASRGRSVLLLDHREKIGKKIYATGNGKCNFTNEDMELSHFRGDRELLCSVLGQFGREETLRFFRSIGILPKCRNGYYYPNSQTAASVVLAFELELKRLGVSVMTGVRTEKIFVDERGFFLCTAEGVMRAEKLIIATGLLASPKLGSDGSAMNLVKSLGHRFSPIVPALCGFRAKGMRFSEAAGVRTDGRIRLFVDGEMAAEDTGELQFCDYGISGIPVFQVSRYASLALREKKRVTAELDLFPGTEFGEVERELSRRFLRDERGDWENLNGLLNPKLFSSLLGQAGIKGDRHAERLEPNQIRRLARAMKAYPLTLSAPRGFEHAQVCAGGIRGGEVEPATLESRLQEGLFFCGEILNVDGICGGYNLQWAWSSGAVAGCLGESTREAAGRT